MLRGRYGWDNLSAFLLILSLIPLISVYTLCLSVLIWIYVLYRTFSRNVNKRAQEKQSFDLFLMKIAGNKKVQDYAQKRAQAAQNRAQEKEQKQNYRFFTCPQCGTRLRVPRGKGKIRLTCAKCGNKFERKT